VTSAPHQTTDTKLAPSGSGTEGPVDSKYYSPGGLDHQSLKPECPTVPGTPFFPPVSPGDPYSPPQVPTIPGDPEDDSTGGKCPELQEAYEEKCDEIAALEDELGEAEEYVEADQDEENAADEEIANPEAEIVDPAEEFEAEPDPIAPETPALDEFEEERDPIAPETPALDEFDREQREPFDVPTPNLDSAGQFGDEFTGVGESPTPLAPAPASGLDGFDFDRDIEASTPNLDSAPQFGDDFGDPDFDLDRERELATQERVRRGELVPRQPGFRGQNIDGTGAGVRPEEFGLDTAPEFGDEFGLEFSTDSTLDSYDFDAGIDTRVR
jgi:hypothetical protein